MPRKPQPHLSPAIYPLSQGHPIYTPSTARSYFKISGVGAWWCRASLAPWTRGARGSRDGCRTRASLAGGSGASGLRMVRFVFGIWLMSFKKTGVGPEALELLEEARTAGCEQDEVGDFA